MQNSYLYTSDLLYLYQMTAYSSLPEELCLQLKRLIPFLFQPVKFKDNLYVDGGLKGHFPIEACKSDNYLGLNVQGGTCSKNDFSILKDLPILGYTMSLMNDKDNNIDPDDKMIFSYNINSGLNFTLGNNERQIIIEKGYNMTIEYLENL